MALPTTGQNPDPSTLTTAQLQRELVGLRQLLETRMDASDMQIADLKAAMIRLPMERTALIDKQISAIKEYFEEKFKGVETQFIGVEKLTSAMQSAAGTAITAAFAAADKQYAAQNVANADSIRKSETNFAERLKGVETLQESTKETLSTQIGELRARIDRGDGGVRAVVDSRNEHRLDVGGIVSIIAAIISAAAVVVAVVAVTLHHA